MLLGRSNLFRGLSGWRGRSTLWTELRNSPACHCLHLTLQAHISRPLYLRQGELHFIDTNQMPPFAWHCDAEVSIQNGLTED